MSDVQTVYLARVQLYLFAEDTGQYNEYGACGCCIMGSPSTLTFKLGCYSDSGEYHCTTSITSNNETSSRLALQGNGYVSFKDEQGRAWSMLFASDAEAIEFAANFAVAMYGAAGSPEANIVACDVNVGKKDRQVFANDKVKARYQSWVVQRGAPGKEVSKLGSKLETNEHDEKPYMFTVPANHISVTPDMKGFEGMIVGVGEESQRFVVIPQNAKRGSGPNVHMCFYVNVLKKKDEPKPSAGGSGQPMQAAGMYPQQQMQGQYQQQPMGVLQPQFQPQYQQSLYQPQMQQQHQEIHTALVVPAPAPAPVVVEAPPVAVAPPPVVVSPPPPPPGFNSEQLQIVDRMRDQIQALTQQLREATVKLDLFNNDFKVYQQKTKPLSLGSAQLEHTIQSLIQDTENGKEELHQRDSTLKQVEDKNKELQKKVDRFTATANQLAEEKKSAINLGSEEKIDMDRRIAQLQGQLTRIQGEREDVSRHLSTTKRLLEISDQDLKGEKGKLQIALVQFQTNDSKMAACDESLIEERSRRKLLESKCAVLGDELRSLSEQLRVKDGQMEERRRKMEADKLHYNQIMDDERNQAAGELRELRQELVDELAIRDRRYQEERQRVAHESFERGRAQGVEDGHSAGLLEADQKVQELVLSVQRNKSEVETIKIRLRQAREQADADQRRLNAQISALQRTVDDLDAQNTTTELEMDSLRSARGTVEAEAYDRIAGALRGLSQGIGRRDLLEVLHSLRQHKTVDYGFETHRREEIERRSLEDHAAVKSWVRGALNSTVSVTAVPPLRTKAPEEKSLPSTGDVYASSASEPMTELPPELAASVVTSDSRRDDRLLFDPDVMNRRYQELLSQLDNDHPDLGLIERKPPPPPRPPTPPARPVTPPRPATPPRQPTPPREPTPPRPRSPSPVEAPPAPVQRPATPPRSPTPPKVEEKAPQPLPPLSDTSDDEQPPPTRSIPRPKAAAPVASDSDDEEIPPPPIAQPQPPAQSPPSPPQPAVPSPQQQKKAFASSDSEEEEQPPVAPAKTQQPSKVAAPKPAAKKSATMFADSDDDDAPAAQSSVKPVAPPKRAAPSAKKSSTFDDSGDSDAAPSITKAKALPKSASKVPPKKKSMFDDSDDGSDVAPPPKASAKKSKPVKKKSMFDDSD